MNVIKGAAMRKTLGLTVAAMLAANALTPIAHAKTAPKSISQSACSARAGHLLKVIETWSKPKNRRVAYDTPNFWNRLGLGKDDVNARRLKLGNYLKFEDGVKKPYRTGHEVQFYQRLKVAISKKTSGGHIAADDMIVMGLESCKDASGNANLQETLLTIHNVIRLLARPQQWTGATLPGDYGHPASDPAYPILQDVLGRQTTGGRTLAEIYKMRLKPNGEVVMQSYSMSRLFDPKTGPFQPQPGARNAEWNAGCHYYYWIGALGRTTLGGAAIIGGLVGEKGGKQGNEDQGTVEISHFVCGSIFGTELFKNRAKMPPLPDDPLVGWWKAGPKGKPQTWDVRFNPVDSQGNTRGVMYYKGFGKDRHPGHLTGKLVGNTFKYTWYNAETSGVGVLTLKGDTLGGTWKDTKKRKGQTGAWTLSRQ
jgi:hypothetical protein